jgi:hypothetical protein
VPPKGIHYGRRIKASVGAPEAGVEPGRRRRWRRHNFSHQRPCGGAPRIGGLLRSVELHKQEIECVRSAADSSCWRRISRQCVHGAGRRRREQQGVEYPGGGGEQWPKGQQRREVEEGPDVWGRVRPHTSVK